MLRDKKWNFGDGHRRFEKAMSFYAAKMTTIRLRNETSLI